MLSEGWAVALRRRKRKLTANLRTNPTPPPPPPSSPLAPSLRPGKRERNVPSTLLRARSAAQLLQHFPLAQIVLFNQDAEAAFRPRFFICFPQTRKEEDRREEEKWEEEEKGGKKRSWKRMHAYMCTHTHKHTGMPRDFR